MALGHYDKAPSAIAKTLRDLKIYRINYFEYKRFRDRLFYDPENYCLRRIFARVLRNLCVSDASVLHVRRAR